MLSLMLLGFYATRIAAQERSYQITDYQAQVYILENGDVQVSEIFTYDFEGNFNGIIRSIDTKGSDGIVYFQASEYYPQRKTLEISQTREGETINFRIYDQSSKERKSFLLEYQLQNVVTKYNDIAEFYWKFFDHTNTSPIDRVQIEVIFPNRTVSADDLRVFGHGPAQGQVTIGDQGIVLYEVDGLSAGEMVEARVLFPPSFIPAAGKVIAQDQFEQIMQEGTHKP